MDGFLRTLASDPFFKVTMRRKDDPETFDTIYTSDANPHTVLFMLHPFYVPSERSPCHTPL